MSRPLSEEARRKAQLAAQEVIAEHGIEGFTVDAVARRSGVAKTTIYRHWPSSEALLLDAIDCMVTEFPTPDTGSFIGDLREFLGVLLPAVADPAMIRTILGVMAAAAGDPELDRVHQELMAERKEPLRTIVAAGIARGEVRNDVDVDLICDLVEGPFMVRKMVRRVPGTQAETDRLIELIARAIAP
jgi:AcrR family transcriptional regulator